MDDMCVDLTFLQHHFIEVRYAGAEFTFRFVAGIFGAVTGNIYVHFLQPVRIDADTDGKPFSIHGSLTLLQHIPEVFFHMLLIRHRSEMVAGKTADPVGSKSLK